LPKQFIVIGAGMGGLAAAADLARQGCDVTVLERAAAPGGKARMVPRRCGPCFGRANGVHHALDLRATVQRLRVKP
jgi:phytoene dehydrogenase-like protein